MRKRTYKKAASFVLALAMAVSVCTAALADNSNEPPTPEMTVSEQNGAPGKDNTAAGENTQQEETDDEGELENDIAGQAAGTAALWPGRTPRKGRTASR